MIVKVTMTHEEVLAAVRAWLTDHGIPAIGIDQLSFYGRESKTKPWTSQGEIKVNAEFSVDSVALEGEVKRRGDE